MRKVNYLITAIILTFTLTLYVRNTETTSFNTQIKPSYQQEEVLSLLFSTIKLRLNQNSLASLESILACIVDIGK
jgi:hypothetical protein